MANNTKSEGFHYDRIKSVIDYVLSSRHDTKEALAGRIYEQQLKRVQASLMDVGWKSVSRLHYPHKTSSVGDQYQATDLPNPTNYAPTTESDKEYIYERIWDPKMAESKGSLNYIHTHIKPNMREGAFAIFHEESYDVNKLLASLSTTNQQGEKRIRSLDGSDWSNEEREQFHNEMYIHGKRLGTVAKRMKKSVNNCHCYYLGTYKNSEQYKILKAVCSDYHILSSEKIAAEKSESKTSSYMKRAIDTHDDFCGHCKGGGSLLCCDTCDNSFHLTCLSPPLLKVPEGDWICDDCVNKKVSKAKQMILSQGNDILFHAEDSTTVRKDEQQHTSSCPSFSPSVLQATPDFLLALRGIQ